MNEVGGEGLHQELFVAVSQVTTFHLRILMVFEVWFRWLNVGRRPNEPALNQTSPKGACVCKLSKHLENQDISGKIYS